MDNIEVTVDDNNSQSQSDENSRDEKRLDELFRVLRPLCLQYLKASQLITYLTFMNEHAKKISKTERKSSPEATKLLFELIEDSDEPNKWNKFTLALEEAEFLSLYKICTVCEKNNFDSYVKIFDLLSVDFAEHGVDILNLSQRMLQLESLTKEQFEEIVLVSEEEGEVAAILEFISCQPSSIGKWFKDLSSCLSDLKKTDLHKLIQNKGAEIFPGNEDSIEILIECWKSLIVNRVRVSDIWSHLKSGLALAEPFTSSLPDQERMENILEEIKYCSCPGKWRSFYNALQAAGYESLCKKLDGDTDVKDDENYLKLITICAPEIRKHISVSELLCQLASKGVITQQNSQEIKQCKSQKGDIAAAELLLDSIHRKKENWFSIFLQCLLDNKQQAIVEKIDPDFKGLLQVKDFDEDSSLNYMTDENGKEFEIDFFEEEKKQIVLRKYQKELLEEARKGKNCIICAPTGSGKTIVALKLIEEHLAQNDGEIHKVVFLANQVALVQQQGRQSKCYLHQYRTYVLTGNDASENRIPLHNIIPENDIIILTPRILLDNLNDGNLPTKSLSQFSLMIFDECHHTNKKHPYNELMAKYIAEKVETGKVRLPQIIGLTASIGVGGAKTEEQAVHHIQTICASLDCEEICTIDENLPELKRYVSNPTDDIIIVEELSDDPFKYEMNAMMEVVEKKFKDPEVFHLVVTERHPILVAELNEHINDRGKNLYTTWLGKIKKCIYLLKNPQARWWYLDCWEFLNIYHNALIIKDSCRIEDAIVYIESRLENPSVSSISKSLKAHWDQKKKYFQQLSQDPKYFNPLLKRLEDIAVKTIKKIPDSRILIFVKTRTLVSALTNWIKDSEQLKSLNPEQLVGGSKRVDNSGMTTQQQEQKLAEFKLGNCKLLVATLGEEGLDIEKCNLVLNFNDVKNEISLVQKRGRARAKNSQYITLANASSGIRERELGNKAREKMMYKALKKVQQLKNEDPEKYIKIMEDLQKNNKSAWEYELKSSTYTLNPGEYLLRCIKCSEFLCLSSELRVIPESHHTLINDDFELKISVKTHPRPKKYDRMSKVSKIYCRKCATDLGIKVIFKGHLFPVIKISSFIICDSSNNHIYLKKWRDTPFEVQEIIPEEMIRFPLP